MARVSIRSERRRRRPRRATALVEAAIILPLVLLMLFGLIEYGWLFIKQQQVSDAARQGARLAALPDTTATTLSNSIGSLMSAGKITSYTATTQPSGWATAAKGTTITVSISVDYTKLRMTGGRLVPVPSTLNSTVSMSKEGP
jgi:Flp pilus assembly protein TadG